MADQKSLKSILELLQLYAVTQVTAKTVPSPSGFRNQIALPAWVEIYCDHQMCVATMAWDLESSTGEPSFFVTPKLTNFLSLTYTCRHCQVSWVRFELSFQPNGGMTWSVVVHGIVPKKTPDVAPMVAAALLESDRDLYQKALRCRTDGMSLGALAYLRRVVENGMNLLLDLLAEVLTESDVSEHREYVEQVVWLKGQKAFDKKATAAAAVLPRTFFAGGHNPFARLHDWASVGVHDRSEEECAEIFDELREVFEALFERLSADRDAKRLYAERLGKLSRKVPAKAISPKAKTE